MRLGWVLMLCCMGNAFHLASTARIRIRSALSKQLRWFSNSPLTSEDSITTASNQLLPISYPQRMDVTTLHNMVDELKSILPAKIEHVIQNDEYHLYIALKSILSEVKSLQVFWHPQSPWFALAHPQFLGKTRKQFSFESTLSSFVNTLTIVDLDISDYSNRILYFELATNNISPPKFRLYFELNGVMPNVILVDINTNSVLTCAVQQWLVKHNRLIQISQPYTPYLASKDLNTLLNSSHADYDTFCQNFAAIRDYKRLFQYIMKLSPGLMSPNVAHSLLQDHQIGEHNFHSLDDDVIRSLHSCYNSWLLSFRQLDKAESSSIKTHMILQPRTIQINDIQNNAIRTLNMYVVCKFICNGSGTADIPNSNGVAINSFIQTYYHTAYRQYQFETYKVLCHNKIKKLLEKSRSFIEQTELKYFEAMNGKVEEIRDKANLINSYLHTSCKYNPEVSDDHSHAQSTKDLGKINNKVKSKPAEYKQKYIVHCVDFVTEEKKTIIIDNGMVPEEYTAFLYKQAKKMKRSCSILKQLIDQAHERQAYLLDIESSIDNIVSFQSYNDIIALKEIEDEIASINFSAFLKAQENTNLKAGQKYDSSSKKSKKSKISTKKVTSSQEKDGSKDGSQENGLSRKKLIGLLVLSPKIFVDSLKNKDIEFKSLKQTSLIKSFSDEELTMWSNMPSLVVGRNSKQNERITFDLAKDHHLWFHVEGSPGSHCLLLLDQGSTFDQHALQFAADVAAYHSQSRGSTKVAVNYCSPKFLRKPPGCHGKLGLVSMTQVGGTILGRPSQGEEYCQLFTPIENF